MTSYERLLAKVRQVRRRWRTQILVKGLSLFLVSAVVLLVLGVWGADLFGFKPAAVWTVRIVAGGSILVIAWYFFCLPLRARVSDVQIAQYIEERYPQLEDRLITAIEYGTQAAESFGMVDMLIRDALEESRRIDFSIFLNLRRLASFGLLGIAACACLFVLLTWGPSFLPYGFRQLYVPWTRASIDSPMLIRIFPGDVDIAKGSDHEIRAQLVGFDSPDVRLYLQRNSSDQWDAVAMDRDPRGGNFRYLLLNIRSSFRYHAESKGVRSPDYAIRVKDVARVENLTLAYSFPPYSGMAPQVVENEGDISALKGTRIGLKIHLSRPVQSARVLFDNQSSLVLKQSGMQDFSGSFALQRSGSYVVQVAEDRDKHTAASPEYEMEAVEDAVPKVAITRPMRDVRATSVEEVFLEFKAEDDIGIAKLELHYSVNGAPEKAFALSSGKALGPSVTGSHTFFLEEFGLQPGDVISYYGKAFDNNDVTGPGVSSSDMYFIQIRPFEQKYVQNQEGTPPGGGQGEEGQEALSKQQKEIISATFKLIREKDRMVSKEYLDDLKSLALVQSRLQGQAQGLVDRLQRRGAAQADKNFGTLSEYLKNAIGEMGKAAVDLGAQNPGSALPPEQKSLQQLMRAESLFREIQVSFAAQNPGGSGSQADAEDLADLFELELDKLKNQYETVQRGEQQSRDQKTDEALQRLKELAQRQQQLNERNRMLAQGQPPSASSGGGGSQSQQQLMEEAEQLRRQLQRLSRERSSPQLSEAGDQLQKAVEEMKKALNDSNRNGAEASAQGMRAVQQLNDAARKLARSQDAGLNQGLEQAADESGKLVEEQKRIQAELDKLMKKDRPSGSGGTIQRDREQLAARKTLLADRLRNLASQIQALSKQARKTQKETSNKLAEAAEGIQSKGLPERITNGSVPIQHGFYDNQMQREDFIREGLEELNKQVEAAKDAMGRSPGGKMEEAANRARQLAEGLESIQQRMSRMQSSRQQGNEPGSQQGQRSQEGSQSEQGGLARQNQQNPQGGLPDSEANARGLSNSSSGPPIGIGTYRNEEERQLSREFEQRLTDARDLRRLLDGNPAQMGNLDRVIEALRRAGDYTNYNNPEQIARLKSAIDYTRKVEFNLARELDRLNQQDKYFFAEDNEAPSIFQKLVEEYFKAIAKSK